MPSKATAPFLSSNIDFHILLYSSVPYFNYCGSYHSFRTLTEGTTTSMNVESAGIYKGSLQSAKIEFHLSADS